MVQRPERQPEFNLGSVVYIWAMFVFTQFIYVFIALQKPNDIPLSQSRFNEWSGVDSVCAVVALFFTAGAWILVPFLVRKLPRNSRASDLTSAFPAFIVRLIFIEIVPLIGLVRVLQTHDGPRILPYFLVSLISMIAAFPNRKNLVRLAKKVLS